MLSKENILNVLDDFSKILKIKFDEKITSFLINLVPGFGKTNQKLISAKKIYAADTGIINLFTLFRDKGSFFENSVFLKIKNRNSAYVY